MSENTELKQNNQSPGINRGEVDEVVSPFKIAWKRLRRNKIAIAGCIILVVMVFGAVFGPMISPYSMDDMDLANIAQGPTAQHLLGTDEVGRDVLFRVMSAGRISLAVGIFAVIVELLIGALLGAISGFYGGLVDGIIMRLCDIFLCFPFLPILMVLGATMSDLKVPPQHRMFVVMFIIGALSWPGLCRIVRGEILSLREQEFMQAAEALGLRDKRKILRHLIPNTVASIIVTATLSVGSAILTESSLSYLGLGVTPPTPSWGSMVQNINDLYILQYQPWRWMPPGICILLTVMAINLFGDGLRDALDPKLKR